MDTATVNVILNVITLVFGGGAVAYWIKGMPERGRVKNEGVLMAAKIEEDMRGEAALRFKEFRDEVHGLRNELTAVQGALHTSLSQSARRGDKLNMVLFILRMVMEALHDTDPENKTLAQARILLDHVEDEPHLPGGSATLNRAEDTVDAAKQTVREVKAGEARA